MSDKKFACGTCGADVHLPKECLAEIRDEESFKFERCSVCREITNIKIDPNSLGHATFLVCDECDKKRAEAGKVSTSYFPNHISLGDHEGREKWIAKKPFKYRYAWECLECQNYSCEGLRPEYVEDAKREHLAKCSRRLSEARIREIVDERIRAARIQNVPIMGLRYAIDPKNVEWEDIPDVRIVPGDK